LRQRRSLNLNLKEIDPEKIKQLIADLEAESNEDKLASYKPYPKQAEFHEAGAKHRERLLMAGNQLGKSLLVRWKPPCIRPGAIPDGGKASDLKSRPSLGLLAPLARQLETLCSEC
jgi:hypothetical protein